MGIVRTDKWMEEANSSLDHQIIEHLDLPDRSLLTDLHQNGMAIFNWNAIRTFNKMKQDKIWEQVESFFKKYRKEWAGPDVPVFLFPARSNLLWRGQKSGLAFKNMVFLFTPYELETADLEALFVHEYHHACRLHRLASSCNNTLLDTVVMEGLAEKAVEEYCGHDHLAPWITRYSDDLLQKLLSEFYQPNFKINNQDQEHRELLYGSRSIPRMAGYAIGYYIVDQYARKYKKKTRDMFALTSEKFLSGLGE